ncbi:MAG: hypothetical protein JWQ35_474 [Bacteriovoracaceae bacterium]|nr:hypothetical protein [Bacteriovoracaceae bacterium]
MNLNSPAAISWQSSLLRTGKLNSNKIKIFAAIIGITLGATSLFAASEKISADLARALEKTEGRVPVIVMMKGVPLLPQTMAMQMNPNDVEHMLKQRMHQLQASMHDYVDGLAGSPGVMGDDAPITRQLFFWNVNALMATASSEIISEMAARDDVTKILLDRRIMLERNDPQIEDLDGSTFTYGLEKIGVPDLRTKHPEITGKGVVVGIIDTGIDAAHPEFKNKEIVFRDFINNRGDKPYDDNGHGTHVAGTISGVGANGTQIGIAPEVKLVVGKVFTSQGSGSLSAILRAMEWIANPSTQGDGKDRPRVVNNSWGGGIGSSADEDPFYQATLTWVQLDIFPCFAAGNSGPSASTVGSPGGLPSAFAIGATDSDDGIASFSSRGPVSITVKGKELTYAKPDVSAPGVKVMSSMPGGKYGTMSGTSMATPHATGAIALLYQSKPNLTIAQVREIMSKSSEHLGDDGMNNTFGSGRINISAAVDAMADMGFSPF